MARVNKEDAFGTIVLEYDPHANDVQIGLL